MPLPAYMRNTTIQSLIKIRPNMFKPSKSTVRCFFNGLWSCLFDE